MKTKLTIKVIDRKTNVVEMTSEIMTKDWTEAVGKLCILQTIFRKDFNQRFYRFSYTIDELEK